MVQEQETSERWIRGSAPMYHETITMANSYEIIDAEFGTTKHSL
jgi:hypothetical protein